ncbi:hypothetical protein HDV63DRAFT_233577 [Trichoderma sp. SZMC 28014]
MLFFRSWMLVLLQLRMKTARTGRLVVESWFSNEIEVRLIISSAEEATLVSGLEEAYNAGRNFSSFAKAAPASNVC